MHKRQNTWFLEAVQEDDIVEIARLLKYNVNPNATCRSSHVSACHIAALSGSNALTLLLQAGADGQRVDQAGRTPLHLAASAGHARHIGALLGLPAGLLEREHDVSSDDGMRAKILNAMTNTQYVNERCQPGTLPEISDLESDSQGHDCNDLEKLLPPIEPGWTPLHVACAYANLSCARLLLAAGADVGACDADARTPIDVIGFSSHSKPDVNVNEFTELITLLLREGGTFNWTEDHKPYSTPLHVAVELGSVDIINQLLEAGVTVGSRDANGETAMHLCVRKRLKKHLQLLLNHNSDEAEHINVKNGDGFSALHAAVEASWLAGVRVALDAGASLEVQSNNGKYPIHTAARLGNIKILQEIVTTPKNIDAIDTRSSDGKTALFIAIEHNHTDCFNLLLYNGASTKTTVNGSNVLHVAAKYGNYNVLKLLLEDHHEDVEDMIDSLTPRKLTPIDLAVQNNYQSCVQLLINHNATFSDQKFDKNTPLHIAASKGYYEIAEMIVNADQGTIGSRNSKGRQPLHEAIISSNRDIIRLLLRNGAKLTCYDGNGKSALNLIMEYITGPTEFLKDIFDSYITLDKDSNIELDYSILLRHLDDAKQLRVIESLLQTGDKHDQKRLLLHPLIESFLALKWEGLKILILVLMFIYMCFIAILHVYIGSLFYYKDNELDQPVNPYQVFLVSALYVCIIIFIIQELFYMHNNRLNYLRSIETWIQSMAILLSAFLPLTVKMWPDAEWPRLMAAAALLLAWVKLTYVVSKFQGGGFFIMYERVAVKVIQILLLFLFLIIGFAMSFMILLRHQFPFENAVAAVMKTMVMMISEFDYNDTINIPTLHLSTLYILRIVSIIFIILSSIVLVNVMIGVAVNDISSLAAISVIQHLERQFELLKSHETQMVPMFLKKLICPRVKSIIKLQMKNPKCNYLRKLPPYIKANILDVTEWRKLNYEKYTASECDSVSDESIKLLSKPKDSNSMGPNNV